MDEKLKEFLTEQYRNTLIKMTKNDIDIVSMGYVPDACTSMMFSILIHCMENIEIFNTTQINDISYLLNKISYVGN